MLNRYVCLIALAALFAASESQAMEKSPQQKLEYLRNNAKQKYDAALKNAGTNTHATERAKKSFTHVMDKINAYGAAVDAYNAEQEAEKENPEYNPATSHTKRKMNQKYEDAVNAYTNAYGPLR